MAHGGTASRSARTRNCPAGCYANFPRSGCTTRKSEGKQQAASFPAPGVAPGRRKCPQKPEFVALLPWYGSCVERRAVPTNTTERASTVLQKDGFFRRQRDDHLFRQAPPAAAPASAPAANAAPAPSPAPTEWLDERKEARLVVGP